MDTTSHGIPEVERDIRRNKWLENRERASHEEPDRMHTNTPEIPEVELNNGRASSATSAAGSDTLENNDIYRPLIERHGSSIEETGNKVKGLLHNFACWFTFSRNNSQGNTDLEAARRGTTGAGSVTAGNNDNTRPLLDVPPLSPEDRDFEKKMADLYVFLCQRKSDIMAGYRGNLLVLLGFTGFLHSVPLNCRIVPLFAILAGLSGLAAMFLGVLSWFEMCDVHQGLIDVLRESGESMAVPNSKKKLQQRNDSKLKTCTIEIAILALFSFFFAGLVFLFVGTGCR